MVDPAVALVVFVALSVGAALLVWPQRGLVPRALRLWRLGERVRLEDALKHIFKCQRSGYPSSLDSLAGHLEVSTGQAAAILSRLRELGLIQMQGDGPRLTPEGEESAVRIVRTHRLWERYLADRTGVPPAEWHDQAELMEHALSVEQTNALESRLGHPSWDPHGDPIPNASGEIPPVPGTGLLTADAGRTVEVVHLEDEPRELYDTLLDEGLVLGGRLDVVEHTEQGVRVRTGDREWVLDAVAARNVTVRELPPGAETEPSSATLVEVPRGETARVIGISRACQGTERRRLLDLGIVRGTEITPAFASTTGDPVAYTIRGALIALRRSQAAWIRVERPRDRSVAEVA